jgi:hypothetical protein
MQRLIDLNSAGKNKNSLSWGCSYGFRTRRGLLVQWKLLGVFRLTPLNKPRIFVPADSALAGTSLIPLDCPESTY